MSGPDIVFEDSDEEIDELEDVSEEEIEEEYIPERDDDSETEDESEQSEGEESEDEDNEVQFEESESEGDDDMEDADGMDDGIDPNEIYDDTPKKNAKAIFNRRKKAKPLKVSKTVKKKKNQNNELVIRTRPISSLRQKTADSLIELTTEKNSKILEKTIFNYTVRSIELSISRKLKKSDLDDEKFQSFYKKTAYEVYTSMLSGVKCKDQIDRLTSNKIGLNSQEFIEEKFRDEAQTKNIQEPPKAKPGIHRCNKCYHNKTLKSDPDRGKRTLSYGLQTRSADEQMTQFITCLDCGCRWVM